MSWLDDILHELGTVGLGAFVLFCFGMFLGYFHRTERSGDEVCFHTSILRWILLCLGVVGTFLSVFFLMPECFECLLVAESFLFVFTWGLVIGFEQRWIWKELFSFTFWFSSKKQG